MLKKIVILIIGSFALANIYAVTPKDPKYCKILDEVQANMNIAEVFLILGPPHSFGQPPNLNMYALRDSQTVSRPKETITIATNNPAAKQRILESMAQDPILGAFINAPPNYNNVLIWNFENNTLNVSVQVRGSTVTNVKTNFTCR